MYNISRVDCSAISKVSLNTNVTCEAILFYYFPLLSRGGYILEKEIYLIKILSIVMKFREIVNQYTGNKRPLINLSDKLSRFLFNVLIEIRC